jgi:hypothetical protein
MRNRSSGEAAAASRAKREGASASPPSQQRARTVSSRADAQQAKHGEQNGGDVEVQSLTGEADNILAEARMVLPGIQTLFGFQLIAVFNERFTGLAGSWQAVHLAALAIAAVAMALVIAPAAYHRLAERGRITQDFIERASRFIACGMLALAISVVLDLALVSYMVIENLAATIAIGCVAAVLFGALWIVWPLMRSRRTGGPDRLQR